MNLLTYLFVLAILHFYRNSAVPKFDLPLPNFIPEILASALTPPTLTISEIMSCPLTGGKEWIELARATSGGQSGQSSPQVPLSDSFSLAGYRLEDDKATIWTGNAATPAEFAQNQELAVIELSKQYLNNTGDTLKLWSPDGQLLDQALLPSCSQTGMSWTFADGEWLVTTPSPAQPNPTPFPNPTPTPSPTNSPTPTPSASASPTPTLAAIPKPSASPAASNTQSGQNDTKTTTGESTTNSQASPSPKKPTQLLDTGYIGKINLTSSLAQESKGADETATKNNDSATKSAVLGASTETTQKTEAAQPDSTYFPLPERSLGAYLSAILGGALLTASGGTTALQRIIKPKLTN